MYMLFYSIYYADLFIKDVTLSNLFYISFDIVHTDMYDLSPLKGNFNTRGLNLS